MLYTLPTTTLSQPIHETETTNRLQASISVLVFLPAFISPFLPNVLAKFVFLIDVIFSYLYVRHACSLVSTVPPSRDTGAKGKTIC